MANNTILIKRSAVPGRKPTANNMSLGELAINTYDGRLYTKRVYTANSSPVEEIIEFVGLQELEPNLGVAPANNSLLASNTAGGRYWLTPNNGIVVSNNQLIVNINNVTVNTAGFNNSSNTTLQEVLRDFDSSKGKTFPFTKTLTITTDWQNTGISGTDLETGSYFVQMFANDSGAGGENINQYYTGTMSWYSGATTAPEIELPNDEIILHRAGAGGDAGMYLRTLRDGVLKLQIYSNFDNASAANYVFKFKKIF
jgi:hypothetical protein